jgi:hypothetical protein
LRVPVPPAPPALTKGVSLEQASPDVAAQSDRLGTVSLALGLVATLLLCIPLVGYGAVALSTLGLLVGLYGLMHSGWRRARPSDAELNAAGLSSNPLARLQVSYALLGVMACFVALVLSLLPLLLSAEAH